MNRTPGPASSAGASAGHQVLVAEELLSAAATSALPLPFAEPLRIGHHIDAHNVAPRNAEFEGGERPAAGYRGPDGADKTIDDRRLRSRGAPGVCASNASKLPPREAARNASTTAHCRVTSVSMSSDAELPEYIGARDWPAAWRRPVTARG